MNQTLRGRLLAKIITHLNDDTSQMFAVGRHIKKYFWQTHFAGWWFYFCGKRQTGSKTSSERICLSGATLELPAASEQTKRGGRHCV